MIRLPATCVWTSSRRTDTYQARALGKKGIVYCVAPLAGDTPACLVELTREGLGTVNVWAEPIWVRGRPVAVTIIDGQFARNLLHHYERVHNWRLVLDEDRQFCTHSPAEPVQE